MDSRRLIDLSVDPASFDLLEQHADAGSHDPAIAILAARMVPNRQSRLECAPRMFHSHDVSDKLEES